MTEAVSIMLMGKKIGYLPSKETHLYHSNKERIKISTIYAIEEDYYNFLQVYIAIELFSEEELEEVSYQLFKRRGYANIWGPSYLDKESDYNFE